MPVIHSKADVLDGRAQVFNYKRNTEHWYYREAVPGEKRYRTKRIPEVTTQSEAIEAALDMYSEFRNTPIEPLAKKETITEPLLPHRSIDLANAEVDSGGPKLLNPKPKSPSFKNRKKKGRDVGEAIDDYLTIQADRVEAALIKEGTFKEIVQTLGVHLKGYFNELGITTTNQMTLEGELKINEGHDTFTSILGLGSGSKTFTQWTEYIEKFTKSIKSAF